MLGRLNARRAVFHTAILYGRPVLFTPNLINRNTVPKGMRMYEMRADDFGQPCELAHSFAGPKYGTVITHKCFSLTNGYRRIRKRNFAVDSDSTCKLKEFMRMYPPKTKKQQLFGQ